MFRKRSLRLRPLDDPQMLLPHDHWTPSEVAFWIAPLAVFFAFPSYLVLGSQIFVTAIGALSLDLILGYAGIVSLGHAAFFGIGAYTAGLLAIHHWGEPLSALLLSGVLAAAVGFLVSFLVVRSQDFARIMVTLGIGLTLYEAANRAAFVTGGVDGLGGIVMSRLLGVFEFGIDGKTAYLYSLTILLLIFALMRRLEENLTAVARPGPWEVTAVYRLFPSLQERRRNLGNRLSGGEQQMLAIGRALMLNPSLLLLDEPMEGLAPIIVQELKRVICNLVKQSGIAVILVEQHVWLALSMMRNTIVLERGQIVHRSDSSQLAHNPQLLNQLVALEGGFR